MIKYYLLLVALIFSIAGYGQYKNYNTINQIWHEGQITLLNEKTIKGSINYNFISETLRYKEGDEVVLLSPQKVLFFEYNEDDKRVKYYVLPFMEEESDRDVPTYFRVVKDAGSYVLLSKLSFEFNKKKFGTLNNNVASPYTYNNIYDFLGTDTEKVYEIFFVANNKGKIVPFLQGILRKTTTVTSNTNPELNYSEEQLTRKQLNREKHKHYKYVNKDALQVVLGTEYNHFAKLVKKEKLDLRDKPDLLKAFDDYAALNQDH